MLRGLRGPLNDGSRGWRGLHGCACEDGSRASWRGGGYSAGKSACSFGYSKNGWYGGQPFNSSSNRLTLLARVLAPPLRGGYQALDIGIVLAHFD